MAKDLTLIAQEVECALNDGMNQLDALQKAAWDHSLTDSEVDEIEDVVDWDAFGGLFGDEN